MTPHLAWSGGPGACDSSGSLRPHLHLTPRTRPNARRPPARRACTRGRWRAPLLRVGEGRRGRVKSPARAEDRAERRLSTHPPDPHWALRDPRRRPRSRQHRGANLHNNLAAAPGLRTGRGGGKGGTRAPALEPAPGRVRGEGQARALRPEPWRARPEIARARTPGGGGGGRSSKRGRAGRSSNCLSPGSLPRPGWPAAGRPESRRRPGESLTYTVNELVAPRVQFLPKAASLNGALLPPTHPRHLLPPARPCLHRGPAHAQPRRPGPRTHPRPGRRASRRGRRGGRASLTSPWPWRRPGSAPGGHTLWRGRPSPRSLAVAAASSGRPGRRLPTTGAQSLRPCTAAALSPKPRLPFPFPSRGFLFLKSAPFITSNLPISGHQLLQVP